jgi:hypothetical protein
VLEEKAVERAGANGIRKALVGSLGEISGKRVLSLASWCCEEPRKLGFSQATMHSENGFENPIGQPTQAQR